MPGTSFDLSALKELSNQLYDVPVSIVGFIINFIIF